MSVSSKRDMVTSSIISMLSSIIVTVFTFCLTFIESRFNIITSPLTGIKSALVGVFFQCFLCYIIISHILSDNAGSGLQPRRKGVKDQVLDLLKSGVLLVVCIGVFYAVAVLFGAPILTKTTETFHFASLLTGLVCLPCFLVVGPNTESLGRVLLENSCECGLETCIYLSTVCSLLGAWLGAIPIPLDWDRPWQEWPITCSLGALAGYTVGLFLAALYIPRRHRSILKTKAV